MTGPGGGAQRVRCYAPWPKNWRSPVAPVIALTRNRGTAAAPVGYVLFTDRQAVKFEYTPGLGLEVFAPARSNAGIAHVRAARTALAAAFPQVRMAGIA
jgi:hypothetical protein